nr:immunoglobulin heavy chain junction region [Macaca mulatta]MPN70331.1 immunoglobulin heavy chain junction region [Macaca mulatta]MPN72461.1 immunoglobulin heavy chain junction region [Macaca mulatta]MPN73130.1 immunoglobulin heavy chain junction region [Macaca mulatta]MPN74715.1 immunoglobulin heavy chain junction region [Macaca mulatta]
CTTDWSNGLEWLTPTPHRYW